MTSRSSWLVERPDPTLFRTWRDYVANLLPGLSVEGQLRLQDHMVSRARSVAVASGGVAGLWKMSPRESRIITDIKLAFADLARRPFYADDR